MSALICISKNIKCMCMCMYVYNFICNVRSQPKINIYISFHHYLGSTNFHAILWKQEKKQKQQQQQRQQKLNPHFDLNLFSEGFISAAKLMYNDQIKSIGWFFPSFAIIVFYSLVYKHTYILISHVIFSFTNQNLTHKQADARKHTHIHKTESKRQATSIRFSLQRYRKKNHSE